MSDKKKGRVAGTAAAQGVRSPLANLKVDADFIEFVQNSFVKKFFKVWNEVTKDTAEHIKREILWKAFLDIQKFFVSASK